MIRILFVCHGNICRSTMAEFIMKDIVNKQNMSEAFHIASSATHTDEIWNGVGSPVYPPARAKLREHGIGTADNELGVSAKRARLTERNDYEKFDFIVGMDSANIRDLRRLFNNDPQGKVHKMLEFAGRDADVADPWYTGNFDATYNDCIDGCHALFRKILTDPEYANKLFEYNCEEDFNDEYDNDTQSYDDFPRG